MKFLKRIWELANNASEIYQFIAWIAAWGLGGSVLIYLGSVTDWAQTAGPFGWAIIAISIMSVATASYFFWTAARYRAFVQKYILMKIETDRVNVLAEQHDRERINLNDFYHPFFVPTEGVRFADCEMLGPSTIYMIDANDLRSCKFVHCNIVIVKIGAPMTGVIGFKDCRFTRCRFFRVTLVMNRNAYAKDVSAEMKQGMPVISDGNVGV